MFSFQCKNDTLSAEHFSKPMPWIGSYIAAASFVYWLAMMTDFIASLAWKIMPIQYKCLPVNSISLTIFAIAIKLSTDLTTPMPQPIDQMAKLSTSSFICVVLSNSIPSLGKMSNRQAVTNVIALAILIITSVVNLCIQLSTGVIFENRISHVLLIAMMLFLLTLCGASVISLASIKDYLQVIYEKQHYKALQEFESDETKALTEKLEDYLTKFSIMAQSSCPHCVLTRSATWSTILGFLSSIILIFFFMGWACGDCYTIHVISSCGKPISVPDYKSTTSSIFHFQVYAIVFGLVPRRGRHCHTPKLRDFISWQVTRTISIGNYLMQSLLEMKENGLLIHIHSRHCRKVIEGVKDAFLYVFIIIYRGVIVVSQLIYILWPLDVIRLFSIPINFWYQLLSDQLDVNEAMNLNSLEPYVLHLLGEEESAKQMLSHCIRMSQLYLERGRQKQPNLLIKLLSKFASPGFDGIFHFDCDQVPLLLDSQQPPSNCWTLPLVTLTSIVVALPKIDRRTIDKLLLDVSEGLLYVNQIEDCLNDRREMIYVKKASKMMWKGVDLHRKWFDVDLVALARHKSNPKEVLEFLADSAKTKFLKSREGIMLTSVHHPSIWSAKEVATHSMYRISKTLLLDCINGESDYRQSKRMFTKLAGTISDIVGACLTNLKGLILKECARSSIEERDDTAFHMLDLFGKTKQIIEILEKRKIPKLNSDQLAFIDEWRLSHDASSHLASFCP